MISGRLKDQILIYAETEIKDNFAEAVKSYTNDFPVRAEISFQNGTEAMFAQMSQAAKTMKFKVRFHLTRFNERQLIKFRNQYYNIRSIDPDRNRDYLILTADRIPYNSVNITTVVIQEPLTTNLRNLNLLSAEIDSRLIAIAAAGTTQQIIDIRGNEPRTAASDAAVTTLTTTLDNTLLEDLN